MDAGNTCIVTTKAYYIFKSPYKLILKSALKKGKQFYIRPNKETGSYII
jgi:hypothetical protein